MKPIDEPEFPYITYRRGAGGLTPIVHGTGLRVQTIVGAQQFWNMAPAEIAADYGLTEQQVSAALDFYEVHRDEINSSIREEAQREALQTQEPASEQGHKGHKGPKGLQGQKDDAEQ